MPPSPQTNKLTSTLRLLIPRLRLLQKKDTASSVIQRRELAQLLGEGRDANARIRVENVIATDTAVEVMEMVELYCELLLARANVLDKIAFGEGGQKARNKAKELWKRLNAASAAAAAGKPVSEEKAAGGSGGIGFPFRGFGKKSTPTPHAEASTGYEEEQDYEEEKYIDHALDEAAVAIFYAWSRFPHDIRELTILRSLLADRWGKEFMLLAQDNKLEGVAAPERLVKGLRVRAPSQELVESYLAEIARAYGVSSSLAGTGGEKEGPPGNPPEEFGDTGDGGDGDTAETATAGVRRPSDTSDLPRSSPPRGLQPGRNPVSVAPPAPRTDNPSPHLKLPDKKTEADSKNEVAPPRNVQGSAGAGGIPELDELTRRFAALRK